MAETLVPARFTQDMSPGVSTIKIAETYLVCCIGVDRETTHSIRNSYRYGVSDSAVLLSRYKPDYNVRVIGLYNQATYDEIIERVLPLKPSLLILGRSFQAPYTPRFRDLVRDHKPAVLRLGSSRIPVSQMPDADYYLGTYAVFPESDINKSQAVSTEIDYGILINMNLHNHVSVNDMYVDLGKDYKDSNAFLKSVLDDDTVTGEF